MRVICDFQCAAIGLLLSDKVSNRFFEFTFNVFDMYMQIAIFFYLLHITYIRGFWDFNCLLEGIGKIGMVFDSQSLSLTICYFPS